MSMQKAQCTCIMYWVGTVDKNYRHGYSGQQKGTICDTHAIWSLTTIGAHELVSFFFNLVMYTKFAKSPYWKIPPKFPAYSTVYKNLPEVLVFAKLLPFGWSGYHQLQDQPIKELQIIHNNIISKTLHCIIMHTSMFVSKIGMIMINTIHKM